MLNLHVLSFIAPGLYEQHFIAHGMMYAACLGQPGIGSVDGEREQHANCPSGGILGSKSGILGIVMIMLLLVDIFTF